MTAPQDTNPPESGGVKGLGAYPTRDEALSILADWQTMYIRTTEMQARLTDALQLSPENDLIDVVWDGFAHYTAQVAHRLGDRAADPCNSWLHWYCWDNDRGAKGGEAGYDGQLIPVRGFDALMTLIDIGSAR